MQAVVKSCKWENVALVWFFNYNLFALWVACRCSFVCVYTVWSQIFAHKLVNRNSKDGFVIPPKGSLMICSFFQKSQRCKISGGREEVIPSNYLLNYSSYKMLDNSHSTPIHVPWVKKIFWNSLWICSRWLIF